jgi:DNA-binding XRE family transcriptional regulator
MILIVCRLIIDILVLNIVMRRDKTNIKNMLGEHIKMLRKEKGLSQEELSYETGLHRTYIGGIERGERNVSIENIEKIANALRIKLKDLFDF